MEQSDTSLRDLWQKSGRRLWQHGREVMLAALALLLILVSASLIALTQMNNIVSTDVAATAVVHDKAISTAYVATTSARAKATALAQAHARATAQAIATATATVTQATATAIASANPYPPHTGTLAFDDTLSNNSSNGWSVGSDKNGDNCSFTGGSYLAKSAQQNLAYICYATTSNFSNFVYQVQMRITSGDAGGINFRANQTGVNDYLFAIYANGSYFLYKGNKNQYQSISSGSSGAIKTGLNQTNLVAVIAHGSSIALYVNHQQIASVNDSSYGSGEIGVSAVNISSGSTQVAFSNAELWTL
jgi:hypothetical protein